MACLPTHLSSTCDSVKNNSLLTYHVEGHFVRVGNTKSVLLSGLVLPTRIKGLDLLSRVEPPTGTKGGPFVRVGGSTWDKKPLSPTLARLAIGPGTKATFCSRPKGNRDKRPGTKAYSVVVVICKNTCTEHWRNHTLLLLTLKPDQKIFFCRHGK